MNNIMRPYCDCEDFYLEFAGEHIKAICQKCGKVFRRSFLSRLEKVFDLGRSF